MPSQYGVPRGVSATLVKSEFRPSVATVARPDGPDRPLLGEMEDVATLGAEVAEGVQALHEVVGAAEPVARDLPHPSHDAHAGGDVRAVGDLDADLAVRRGDGTHEVGDDVHDPIAHRAGEERTDLLLRSRRRHPVVVWTRVVLVARAHERQVLGAGDVVRVATMQVAARELLL